MRRKRSRSADTVTTMASEPMSAPITDTAAYSSPGLKAVWQRLPRSHPPVILDLGPPIAANLAALQNFTQLFCILDLLRDLRSEPGRPSRMRSRVSDVLVRTPVDQSASFDVILAWDVLDYVDESESATIVRWLAVHATQKAQIFTVFSTGGVIPDQPSGFAMVGDDRIERRVPTPGVRPGRGLTPAEIDRLLGPFQVTRSFLLPHGAREVVAQRTADTPDFE